MSLNSVLASGVHPTAIEPSRSPVSPPGSLAVSSVMFSRAHRVLWLQLLAACASEHIDSAADAGRDPGSPVGQACIPTDIPSAGFSESEAYLETNHAACQTGICLVSGLSGDPRPGCTGHPGCASPSEVAKRVFCTCRCAVPEDSADSCTCPSGFSCMSILGQGAPTVRGSYCVRGDVVPDK
jgi:hypothetical protein